MSNALVHRNSMHTLHSMHAAKIVWVVLYAILNTDVDSVCGNNPLNSKRREQTTNKADERGRSSKELKCLKPKIQHFH